MSDQAALTDQQKAFIQRFIGPLPPASDQPPPLVELGKSRIEWNSVRQRARSEAKRLKTSIREAYEEYSDLLPAVDGALAKIDRMLSTLDEDLHDQLDLVLNAPDATARKKSIEKAQSTVRRFMDFSSSDPVASSIDDNGFDDSIQIVAPVVAQLKTVQTALGRMVAEAD